MREIEPSLLEDLETMPVFYLGHLDDDRLAHLIDEYEDPRQTDIQHYMHNEVFEHLPFPKIALCFTGHHKEDPTMGRPKLLSRNLFIYGVNVIETPNKVEWMSLCQLTLVELNGRDILTIIPGMSFLDKSEMLTNGLYVARVLKLNALDQELSLWIQESAMLSLRLAMHLLVLLSCKNVITVDEVAGGGSPAKRAKTLKKRPELAYKAIHIKVPGKRYQYKGQHIDTIPYHECAAMGMSGPRRGHFKTYTEEAPLFGKHTGTWYWSPVFNTSRGQDYIVSEGKRHK